MNNFKTPVHINLGGLVAIIVPLLGVLISTVVWGTTLKDDVDSLERQTIIMQRESTKLIQRLNSHDVQDAVNEEKLRTINSQMKILIEQNYKLLEK